MLKELGTEFYKGKKIDTLMVKGAVLNIECKLLKMEKLGDHTMVVGEALEASASEKKPLIYHRGKYWHLGKQMQKPPEAVREKISKLVEKYKKN